MAENKIFRVGRDGYHGELFCPDQDKYPGKAMVCFSGSDGNFTLTRKLAETFRQHGLTALAFAYVMEDGLPREFYHIPIDMLEAAVMRLHRMGYEKVGLWGISKGAELALAAGSLLPGLVNAVTAVAPINTVCQGFGKKHGICVMPGSTWSFHGVEVPYTSFGLDKFPLAQVLRKSLLARELSMYDLYLPLVETPNPAGVIQVEKITGPILLITSKMDTMWPSVPAAEQIMARLKAHGFSYPCQHLNYDYGSHLFVPIKLGLSRFFRGDRGKYRALSWNARTDSLAKTLEFTAQW